MSGSARSADVTADADASAAAVAEVWEEWKAAVNMTAKQLETWLETEESRAVGYRGADDTAGDSAEAQESVGHRSGRRIVELLRTNKADLTTDDAEHMRKVVGYVHRHLAQRPSGDVTETRWRYSLMNWGHDPLID